MLRLCTGLLHQKTAGSPVYPASSRRLHLIKDIIIYSLPFITDKNGKSGELHGPRRSRGATATSAAICWFTGPPATVTETVFEEDGLEVCE